MRLHETLKAFPLMGCSPPLKAQNVHAVSHVFPSSRGGTGVGEARLSQQLGGRGLCMSPVYSKK